MNRRARNVLAALLALAVIAGCGGGDKKAPSSEPAAAPSPPKINVVLFVIDGPRYSETFGDSTHAHIPHIWNELRPQGTLFTDFRNEGETKTVPGHSSILTGTWQHLDNTGKERPTRPTLFEYYRAATGAPATDAYVISGKPKLHVCSYSTDSTYGAPDSATAIAGLPSDDEVYTTLISTLASSQPRVVMACFPDVDRAGHTGDWKTYIAAIENVDSLAARTWDWLQHNGHYAERTVMFITNDHGRHDDAHGGFQNHGDGCEGCRHLIGLALGPGIPHGKIVGDRYTQRDVCPTMAAILDIPAPEAKGRPIEPILETSAAATPQGQ